MLAFFLFDGLPLGWQVFFMIAFTLVAIMFGWTVLLFVRGGQSERDSHRDRGGRVGEHADEFLWVFLVPALNEETTIRDSVERLLKIRVRERRIVVIDDGSEDSTPDILQAMGHRELIILRRDPPNARKGKAAALNDAYQRLGAQIGDVDRSKVIICVVDADGRLDPDAPAHAAEHFIEPTVGGVQSLVRIYNRRNLLARMQDLEFGVYGHLFQAGRNHWGTAGMGGNGQFNRLSALDDVADEVGPWRDRLTEDQDLGLRLIANGWKGRQDLYATVSQQGLSKLTPLLRQRTRWSQGNLQAFNLAGEMARAPLPLAARIEQLVYLLMPIWQGVIGVAFVASIVLAILGIAPFWGGGPTWQLLVVYLLVFGGTVMGCVAARRRQGIRGFVLGLLIGHAYSLYTWLIWPVLARSVARHLTKRNGWAKTNREPIVAEADPPALVDAG